VESALEPAKSLSRRLHNKVLLKREDQQPVFSFKLRGAYNKMAHLTPEQLKKGVICASAGNHAQGVALSAHKLGCRAVIVMPTTTPQLKVDAVKALGGEAVLFGDSYSDAYNHSLALQKKQGLTFVHPFDDPDVIAGQGTIAMEMLRQHQGPLDAVFVAIGGGGLISGVAAYIKAVRPEVKVIGVQMNDSDAMMQSVAAGKRVTLDDVGLFSDGTAVKLVGEETFRLTRALVDDFIAVDTDAVCAAIKDVFVDTRSIVEPAGALAVAAIKQYVAQHKTKGETYAAILCGANMNFDRLRFVAERAEVGEADARRSGAGAHPPHGGRSFKPGTGRAPAALRLPRAPRRAAQVPQPDAPELEHQPVPLPQPGRRLRSHPGRAAGAEGRRQGFRQVPGHAGLLLCGGNPQPGLPHVPAGVNMKHPQAARTTCRCATPLAGGNASGPAKPVPRRSPVSPLHASQIVRGTARWSN